MAAVTEPVARPLSPRDTRLAPWRAFLEAHARVSRRLDEELRAEHDLSLAEYDTLLTIAWAPERRIRMRSLADSILLSKSGVTRLIDRLVADGLVERSACLSDARGAEAVLTDAGLDRLRQAARTHLRGIEEHFLGALAPGDGEIVERVMRTVSERSWPSGLMPFAPEGAPHDGAPQDAGQDGPAAGDATRSSAGTLVP